MRKTSRARVLVVEDMEIEAKLLMRALADAGYSNLVHRQSVAAAIAEIAANPPRLVITDLKLGDGTGLELTQHIRTVEASYTYVVMLTSAGSSATLGSCFEAGVDDFVEKPLQPETLVWRLHAGERIIALESNLRAKSRELETALRRIDVAAAQRALATAAETVANATPAAGATPLDALLGTDTWRDVESVLTKAMNEFFQLPFAVVKFTDRKAEPYVAEVSLSDPSKQIELGLSVVVDTASMTQLGAHLLGDEDLEGAQALVLEVANILMGTLKAAFIAHGFTFTGGIPTAEPYPTSRSTFDRSQVRSRMAIAAGTSEVELWLRVKEKSNTILRGKALREGLVVSEDVRDARGMLLIRGGSRLTQTAAERLAKLLPDLEISVSDPNC